METMSNMQTHTRPELLAPAGNLAAALAALRSGADAVYAGLGRFNAREMGENFDYDDMSRLSAKTKTLRRKLYITLNTLIKEQELDPFARMVEEVAMLEPDAVIVQDIGAVRYIRETYPWLEIHASTQMGIHNSAGMAIAQRMGISRVILERQVTLDEVRNIVSQSTLPVEVFVHGALCCSLSGACLLSSWMGGSSGNRGKCKQPCRRRYHAVENGRKSASGFFLSTKDLYTLDMIGDLISAGVTSLKIEGRLKKPDYVSRVVSAYRLILDSKDGGSAEELGKARGILSGAYGRKWSHGFSTAEDADSLIDETSIGVSGQLVGKVAGRRGGGFVVSGTRRIRMGDRLRIQSPSGDEAPSFTVTKLGNNEKGCFIFYDRDVPVNGLVYRVGSSEGDWEPKRDELPLHKPRIRVDADVKVQSGAISVMVLNAAKELVWERDLTTEHAKSNPVGPADIARVFQATRSTDIVAGVLNIEVSDGLFIPAKALKEARREFWEWLEGHMSSIQSGTKSSRQVQKKPAKRSPHKTRDCYLAASVRDRVPKSGTLVSLLGSDGSKTAEVILPAFCSETQLDSLSKKIRVAYERGCRRFRITSLYQLALVEHLENVILTSSYPLPSANSLASTELSSYGITTVQGWLELEKRALELLRDASPVPIEIYRYGRPSLLATRAKIPATGAIQDSRGKQFRIGKDHGDGLTHVYAREVVSLPEIGGTSSYFDFLHAKANEPVTDEFNFSRELV